MRSLLCAFVLLGVAAYVGPAANADPPGQDPHMPNVTIGYCPGGTGGFLATKWCDGQQYPDGSYWHQLIMTGSSFAGPIFRLDCVVFNPDVNPIPQPAPPGGCNGGAA